MFKNVLISIDIEVPDEAQRLLNRAKSLTAGWDCQLHVCTVIPDVGMAIVGSYFDEGFEKERQARVTATLEAAVAEAGLSAQLHVLNGTIYDRIIQLTKSEGIDLILIAAHRPDLSDYLLGTNAARLVRHSKTSVLVLRDD